MAITKELRVDKKYFVKELSTLDNYVLSNEIQKVVLEPGEIKTLTFENELKKGQIKIIKVDEYNNEIKLEGIEYSLMDKNNNVLETLITDKNRRSYIEKIPNNSKVVFEGSKNKSELHFKWRNNWNYIRIW